MCIVYPSELAMKSQIGTFNQEKALVPILFSRGL